MATYSAVRADLDRVGGFMVASVNLAELQHSGANNDPIHAIACELAYDRALINLCLTVGIDTGPERFNVPFVERDRLHLAVVEVIPSLHDVVFPVHV